MQGSQNVSKGNMYLNEKVIRKIYYLICPKALFHLSDSACSFRHFLYFYFCQRNYYIHRIDHLGSSQVFMQDKFLFDQLYNIFFQYYKDRAYNY